MTPDRVGVMPYVYANGSLHVVLILSRDGARWGVPKGRLKVQAGKKRTAVEEAWEEAGLRGRIHPKRHVDLIWIQKGKRLTLRLYPFEVESVSKSYPEKKCRQRRILPFEKARQVIGDGTFDRAFGMIEAVCLLNETTDQGR